VHREVRLLNSVKDHSGYLFGQLRVVSDQREDQVAGLADVDVVLGHVVEEDQRRLVAVGSAGACQRRHILIAKMNLKKKKNPFITQV